MTVSAAVRAAPAGKKVDSLAWAERRYREIAAKRLHAARRSVTTTGELLELADAWKKILRRDPASRRAHFGYARVLEKLAHYPEAVHEYRLTGRRLGAATGVARCENAAAVVNAARAGLAKRLVYQALESPSRRCWCVLLAKKELRSTPVPALLAGLGMKEPEPYEIALVERRKGRWTRIGLMRGHRAVDYYVSERRSLLSDVYLRPLDPEFKLIALVKAFEMPRWPPSHISVFTRERTGLKRLWGSDSDIEIEFRDRDRDAIAEIITGHVIGFDPGYTEEVPWYEVYRWDGRVIRPATSRFPGVIRERLRGIRKMLHRYPTDPALLLYQGRLYEMRGERAIAARSFRLAVREARRRLQRKDDKYEERYRLTLAEAEAGLARAKDSPG